MKPRRWASLLELWPGSILDLQTAMQCDRQSLYWLRSCTHRKPPHRLLASLAAVLAERGTCDGSVVPTVQELTAAWMRAKGAKAPKVMP